MTDKGLLGERKDWHIDHRGDLTAATKLLRRLPILDEAIDTLGKIIAANRASPKASPLQAERLSKFLCHLEACESNPDPYPYAWREADAATCDCGLAAALGASRPSPAERQEKK